MAVLVSDVGPRDGLQNESRTLEPGLTIVLACRDALATRSAVAAERVLGARCVVDGLCNYLDLRRDGATDLERALNVLGSHLYTAEVRRAL